MAGHAAKQVTTKEAFDAGDSPIDEDQRRFLVELEFVQCLANPSYLQCKSCPLSLPITSRRQKQTGELSIAHLRSLGAARLL